MKVYRRTLPLCVCLPKLQQIRILLHRHPKQIMRYWFPWFVAPRIVHPEQVSKGQAGVVLEVVSGVIALHVLIRRRLEHKFIFQHRIEFMQRATYTCQCLAVRFRLSSKNLRVP